MAGLFGVVDEQAEEAVLRNLLQRMGPSLSHEDWYQTALYARRTVGLGHVSLCATQPAPQLWADESAGIWVAFEGEIHNGEALQRQLAPAIDLPPGDNAPALAAYLYRANRLDGVEKFNGSFALAIWDEPNRKLLLINDRYGSRPLYYACPSNRLVFASEVKAVLEDKSIPRTIDDGAVADFLAFQLILGAKTFFTEIKVMPPASVLIYQNGQMTLRQYWDVDFQEGGPRRSEEACVEQLTFLLKQAVERRMGGAYPHGAFLSGGLDSRILLGAIDPAHFPVHSFTVGISESNDVRFAAQIARQVGSVHHHAPFGPDFFPAFAEKGVRLTDGMMSCEHMIILNALSLAREHCRVVFDGLGGGAILGGAYLKKALFDPALTDESFFQSMCARFTSAFSAPAQQNLFTDSYWPRVKDLPQQSVRQAIEAAPPVSFPLKGDYLYLKGRQRRFIYFGPILARSQVECRTPFYDNDLVDFAFTIPPDLKSGERLYLKMLNTAFPALAQIPWAFTGMPPASNSPVRFLARRGLYKIQRELRDNVYKLTAGRVILPYKREYKDMAYWLRGPLKKWVEDILLGRQAAARPYFNLWYLKQLLNEHMSGRYNHQTRLCALVTFELWHRQFID